MIENIPGEKILVTGGTGFLGRHVVKELIKNGVFPTVLTRNLNTNIFDKSSDSVNLIEMDLFDFASLEAFIEKSQPDIIIHCAGYTNQIKEQFDVLEKFNFQVTARLLDLANRVKVKKFILTGSADEYGFQPSPQVETFEAKPVSDYAISKNKAVKYALFLHEKDKFPVVILRPFTIYGIGQPSGMFVSQAVESAVRRTNFEMSKGEQKRDLLFVTDFVNVIIKLLTANGTDGEIYNAGSGQSIALKDLAKKIWKIAGADEKLLKIGARQTNDNELHNTQADITKIMRAINWKPEISLDEGLELVVKKAKKDFLR